MNRAWAPIIPVAISLILSSCGSSAGGSVDVGAQAQSRDAGVIVANANLATRHDNPTSIELKARLSKRPDPGKLIVKLVTPQPVTQVISDGTKAAAEALGWSYKTIPVPATAKGIQKAFQAALELKPAPLGIQVSGYPKVAYAAQLAQAKKRGIAVVSESTTDLPGTGDGIIALLDGPKQVQSWGKDIAAKVISDSNGTAQVVVVSVSAYPILGEFVKGFKAAFNDWCPVKCSITDLDQQATDVGTRTPMAVVSALQRNPKLGYAVFSFGDLTIGLHAALAAAGLSKKVKIAGETASAANLQAVRDGTELAWTGFSATVLGWRTVDAMARFANGDDVSPSSESQLPSQIITKDNVDTILTDKAGFYIGVDNCADQFKKLWRIR